MGKEGIRVFYSYAHEDEGLREALGKHLAALRMSGVITDWHDRKIVPGQAWDDEIHERLDEAQMILLFVSADFLNSPYCREVELTRALQMHEAGKALVVPIIVRPVRWSKTPFARIQALPKDARPVTLWQSEDAAWVDVVEGIERACAEIQVALQPGKQDHIEGDTARLDRDLAVDRIKGMSTEQAPDEAGGVSGNTVLEGAESVRGDLDAILMRLKTLEGEGQQVKEVEIGGTQISRVELLLKKAILLKTEADQILMHGADEFANVDHALHMAKLQEAYALTQEANLLEPTNTAVMLHMAKLLIELTPDDPTDEERLLYRIQNLLNEPKDDLEKFRLAQATFLMATNRKPYDYEQLAQAGMLFEQVGRMEWVQQCQDLLDEEPPPYHPGPGPEPPLPPPPEGFHPVGNWQVKIGDMYNSQMSLSLMPNGTFQCVQQVMGNAIQAMGQWAYNPYNQFLQIQGLVNGFQPFGIGIMIQGPHPGGFFGTGSDGFAYWLYRA